MVRTGHHRSALSRESKWLELSSRQRAFWNSRWWSGYRLCSRSCLWFDWRRSGCWSRVP